MIGEGVKVLYFFYVGDIEVGDCANVGVGMMIVNYDGMCKSWMKIGEDVCIGVNNFLVVLVSVGDCVYIGVGVVICEDVLEGVFGVSSNE